MKTNLIFDEKYAHNWRDVLDIFLLAKRKLTREDEKEVLKLTRQESLLNQFNCMKVNNDPELNVNEFDTEKISSCVVFGVKKQSILKNFLRKYSTLVLPTTL